jgi:hypothetical protein
VIASDESGAMPAARLRLGVDRGADEPEEVVADPGAVAIVAADAGRVLPAVVRRHSGTPRLRRSTFMATSGLVMTTASARR